MHGLVLCVAKEVSLDKHDELRASRCFEALRQTDITRISQQLEDFTVHVFLRHEVRGRGQLQPLLPFNL